MASIFGASFTPAYAASKGGTVQFTRSCAWPTTSRPTLCYRAGSTRDLTKRARKEIDGLRDRAGANARGTLGRIADFAGIAVFLFSAASDFVTGTAIPIDGGYSVMAA